MDLQSRTCADAARDIEVMPVRRDLHFALPAERIGDWHDEGRHVSHFFNALSLFFPDGERFFIHSVRHYRNEISDPTLSRAVTAFIGQEAMHGREHTECNEMLDRAGLPGAPLQQFVFRLTERLKHLPKAMQLSATIALEHLTAIMANSLLQDARVVGRAEPHFARLWRWHALEETEHKAVAYDVWCAVMPKTLGSYLMRVTGLLLASLIFWPLVFTFMWRITRADAQCRAERGGWRRTLRFLFLTPGPLRRAMGEWFDYFKPGFHPWQHDNRRYLAGIEPLLRDLQGGSGLAA
ncbi:metal-dependent hydrolase [Solimonas soli]|uniref:metal-dependent hydrolase n=1 Tax=Solimonas soli TaxID=413479 RepID=UPI0004B4E01A|nr:metal-dependent hydrolase [Solimonas soli]